MVTARTHVTEVIRDPVLGKAGRLLFPVDSWYWSGDVLGDLGYNWYMRLNTQTTVDVVNRLHEDELGVTMDGYSLWGGSAGARMAAWLGSHGTEAFGEREYPRPAAVIMQYTGLSEVYGNEPPTYNCVGTRDGIASWRTMDRRIRAIKAQGTDAMIEVFDGLPHGFGLGVGTMAEGWLGNAAAFWERQAGERPGC